MPQLRVLSWNVRTLGTHPPDNDVIARLARVIRGTGADMVCIQEVMVGHNVPDLVGAEIAPESRLAIQRLQAELAGQDGPAVWQWAVSGASKRLPPSKLTSSNKAKAGSRDAYAYLWKGAPAASVAGHPDAVSAVDLISPPVIVDGDPPLGGRCPAVATFEVCAGGEWCAVNIFSFHAAVPANQFKTRAEYGAGWSVVDLAKIRAIGSEVVRRSGNQYVTDQTFPKPSIDTVVLGDFNFSMDKPKVRTVYQNLLSTYCGCISTPEHYEYTTYAAKPMDAGRRVSAYDNIFVLRSHAQFSASLTPDGYGVTDFIADEADELGPVDGFAMTDDEFFELHAQIYNDNYKQQHGVDGLSDHLPVWTDFAVVPGPNAIRCQRTAAFGGNSLFHALFGTWTNVRGYWMYADPSALGARRDFSEYIGRLADTTKPDLRPALVAALKDDCGNNPSAQQFLNYCQNNPQLEPLADNRGRFLLGQYARNLQTERPLTFTDAALVAVWGGERVYVRVTSGNGSRQVVLNPNGRQNDNRPHLFFNGLQFVRWSK